LIRRLARTPGLRWLATLPVAHRAAAAWRRSLAVREGGRFILRELGGSNKLATYRLRSSAVRVCIRHSTPDLYTLDQVFVQRLFELPEVVAGALESQSTDLRVVDLGANIGLFGASILGRFPGAKIVALEPDPSNARVHVCTVTANRRAESWHLVEACAGTEGGRAAFVPGEFGTSHVAAPNERGTIEVEAVDVFPWLVEAQLIKIDIEGAEWAILADPRFRDLEAVAVHLEYHRRSCPGSDPRARATQALEQAGFRWLPVTDSGEGDGIVWAWRP
jgi:FkbM family methyltransferase